MSCLVGRRTCCQLIHKCRARGRLRELSRAFSVSSQKRTENDSREPRTHDQVYDVVISGGGMVGAAMACALGYSEMLEGKKILLLEASTKKRLETLPPKYSNRTCALSPATVELLSSFGAWTNLCNMRVQAVKRMQVWEACSDSLITFNREDLIDDLAVIVENDVILDGIYKQIDQIMDRVEVRYESRGTAYSLPGSVPAENPFAQVTLESGEVIHTRLLIGADGANSAVRQAANIHTVKWDYQQFGVVATVQLSEPTENNVAWQRFLPTGPVALLPLSDTLSSLVWSTTPEQAKNLVKLPEDSFVDALNHAFYSDDEKNPLAEYAGQVFDSVLHTAGLDSSASKQLPPMVTGVEEGSRAMFPLGLGHATQYVKPRMALIGDAAHRIHPLAGQGVNLGFGDVACLRDQLSKAVYDGNDLGSLSHLLQYETLRQRHVIPTLATMDGLKRLYGTDFTPVVLLRTLGLQATNALKPVKDKLIQHAVS